MAVLLIGAFFGRATAEIPKIIFDTDLTSDVDDMLALAMYHTLADRVPVNCSELRFRSTTHSLSVLSILKTHFTGGLICRLTSRVIPLQSGVIVDV